jgi:hypothetical protein
LPGTGFGDYRHVPPHLAYFWDRVLLTFAHADLESQSSYLSLPSRWKYSHASHIFALDCLKFDEMLGSSAGLLWYKLLC